MEHCLQWKEEIDGAVSLTNGDPIPVVLIANKVIIKSMRTCSDSILGGSWTT